jgi:hypothetical protein
MFDTFYLDEFALAAGAKQHDWIGILDADAPFCGPILPSLIFNTEGRRIINAIYGSMLFRGDYMFLKRGREDPSVLDVMSTEQFPQWTAVSSFPLVRDAACRLYNVKTFAEAWVSFGAYKAEGQEWDHEFSPANIIATLSVELEPGKYHVAQKGVDSVPLQIASNRPSVENFARSCCAFWSLSCNDQDNAAAVPWGMATSNNMHVNADIFPSLSKFNNVGFVNLTENLKFATQLVRDYYHELSEKTQNRMRSRCSNVNTWASGDRHYHKSNSKA